VARDLGYLPWGQIGVDFLGEFCAFLLKLADFVSDIEFVVIAYQSQFINLNFKVGNGLLKFKVIWIHKRVLS